MKKKIKYSIAIIISIILIIYYISNNSFPKLKSFAENNLPKNIYVLGKFIVSNKINTSRNLNDYNIKFLPQTEFIDLEFTKIKIGSLAKENQGYLAAYKKKQFSYHFARHKNFIFLAAARGEILFSDIDNIKDPKNTFKKLQHNIEDLTFSFRDMIIDDDKIYISIDNRIKGGCNVIKIYVAKINISKKLNFKNLFSNSECVSDMAGGRMQAWVHKGEKSILLSTSADILKNKNEGDSKPQDDDSIYGKILVINAQNGNFEIFSKGHRNSIGLYANIKDAVILNTENGPRGGDEINSIIFGKNYGWDIASYGRKYDHSSLHDNSIIDYKLSHEDNDFEEPIFSFVPSIGITEIIKLDNNFSKQWFNNYLIASMNSKHLYRVKFDNNFTKILFKEKIYIGERIRDLFYLADKKQILLALEETGSIGILELKN
tara:strand:- start:96 stop:1388 length:1293 start_codon:yes stop_codon:yes gene_type:complete